MRYISWALVGVRTGMLEMRSQLLRSFLSSLGVLFGVFVMVAMLSLMGGLDSYLKNQMGKWIGSVFIWEMREPPEENVAEFSRSPGLRFSDGLYLESDVEAVANVYKFINRREQFDIGGEKTRASLKGVDSNTLTEDFNASRKMKITMGRGLTESDYRNGSKVCLVSQQIAEKITASLRKSGKDSTDLIGSTLSLYHQAFRVIGVYGPEDGEIRNWHMRRNIYIPLLAMQKYVTGYDPNPGYLWMKVTDPLKMNTQLDEIISALLYRHRGVEDFEYRKPDQLNEFISMMNNVGNIMGVLALISLLAGGLGIMNVMLSSISERVREIGVRKALGAGNIQIFIQFIAETSTLCFLGGGSGAVLGCIPMLFGDAIEKSTGGVLKPILLPQHIFFVSVVIIFMGILFGLYPALKASRMNPIDALRYE
ncbi:MAG: ABC transporter permease [Fibrobacteria bacterium]|nr:ABC transporter permease [Fibrobacteria bacterium]